MVSLILIILGLVCVVAAVLVLLGAIAVGAPWWVLGLVGLILIIVGVYLRRGAPVV